MPPPPSSLPKWKSLGVSSRPKGDNAVMSITINSRGTLVTAGYFDGSVTGYDSVNISSVRFNFNVSEERALTAIPQAADEKGEGTISQIELQIASRSPITALAFRPTSERAEKNAEKIASSVKSSIGETKRKEEAIEEEILLITTSDGFIERRRLTPSPKSIHGGQQQRPSSPSPSSPAGLSFTSQTITLFRERCLTGATARKEEDEEEAADQLVNIHNEIYAACYNPSGKLFATCGLDGRVRVYTDSSTPKLLHILSSNSAVNGSGGSSSFSTISSASHPPRLQAVQFCERNPSIVMAAGWGQSVHFWDIGAGGGGKEEGDDEKNIIAITTTPLVSEVKHEEIFGPYMIGQGLAVANGEIVAVSYRGGPDRLQAMREPSVVEKQQSSRASRPTSAAGMLGGFLGRGAPRRPDSASLSNKVTVADATSSSSSKTLITELKSLTWPASNSNLNFFPICVAASPSSSVISGVSSEVVGTTASNSSNSSSRTVEDATTSTLSTSAGGTTANYFIAIGGGGGMGLTEAIMILDGRTKEVVAEFLAVGCVNCCAFGTLSHRGSEDANTTLSSSFSSSVSASATPTHGKGVISNSSSSSSLILAFGDSKGNVQIARYAQ